MREPVAQQRWVAIPTTMVLAIAAGLAIFIVDTFTPLDTAIAALYGAIVMLLADRLPRRGIILAGVLCIALTLLSFLATHGASLEPSALMRCAVSVSVIAVVTLLAARTVAARQSMRDQAELLDLTHDAIVVRTLSDEILYWNRGAEDLYGWSRHEAVGQGTDRVLKTDPRSAPADAVEQLLRAGRWEGELRRVRRDGSEIMVAVRWGLQTDGSGKPVTVIETSNDVTGRLEAQAALRAAQAELANVSRAVIVGQFTAALAHEINQPLAAVLTNGAAGLRWLDRPEPDVAEALQTVRRIVENGRRAGDVVARLRALARGEERTTAPLDLGAVVTDGLAVMEWDLDQCGVVLDTRVDPAMPKIWGDREALLQVVINLITNAAQAMQDIAPPRLVTVIGYPESVPGGAAACIEVRDRGIGIDPARLASIFEPFNNAQPGRLGLGLSICRTIVEAHGGQIDASINGEGGMTFRFVLPARSAIQPEEAQS
ncbi:two-component system sensor histidine kinase NtrB [Kaistia soli]|uniref:two-component system sensor histidine kinase NtrB n=1 Tax=Kaistia soli TaxID=446684 RepID=UPI00158820B0|nr:ATP-binding protein [Kaistia soli]